LEFLKREEIVTMQKDVARLRETEAQKEKERIAQIAPGEQIKDKKEGAVTLPTKKEGILAEKGKIETLIPKFPRKPSPFQKVLVRIIVVSVLFLFVGFFYWFFGVRKAEKPPEERITPKEEITPPKEEIIEEPEIIIPLSLISVNATETLEVSISEEASTSLSQFLGKKSAADTFTRILIKDSKENKILGLKEFFEVFKIRTPENFYQKTEEDFTLFVYSQEEGERIGFITKIKEESGLEELLKSWEPTMETDFGNLFAIMNKQGRALFPYFKNASYRGISFRYQTFSIPHFGICYSISNQYFIFTSSGKSIMKIIEQFTNQ